MSSALIPFPPAVATRPRRVLAIDDDDGLLDMLNLLLCQTDFDLRTARGGKTGLELAITWEPDVILLDLAMPGRTGLESLPELRRVAPGTQIIVFSGFSMASVAEEAVGLGAVLYLTKGADPDAINDAIEQAVAQPEPSRLRGRSDT